MRLTHLGGIVPNRRACFDLLILIENEYNCSIKLWLDANNPRGGEIGWSVYACGSGGIWDHPDVDCLVGRARVLDAENGDLYRAVWACLVQLADRFAKVDLAGVPARPPRAS